MFKFGITRTAEDEAVKEGTEPKLVPPPLPVDNRKREIRRFPSLSKDEAMKIIHDKCPAINTERYGYGTDKVIFLPNATNKLLSIVDWGMKTPNNRYEQIYQGMGHIFVNDDHRVMIISHVLYIYAAERSPVSARIFNGPFDSIMERIEYDRDVYIQNEKGCNSAGKGKVYDPFIEYGPSEVVMYGHTHAYTDEVIPDPTLTVTNPVVVRNKVTFDLIYQNVKTNEIVYKVEGRDNEDVTDHFTITPNYTSNKLTIVSDNTISGPYALIATYNDLTASQTFRLEISITVEDDTTMNFDDLNLKVAIPKDSSLSLKNLTDNINNNNVEIEIYNSKGTKVEDEEAVLGTGSTIKAGNEEYTIVLVGDSTGDGKIDSADLLKVVRYLKGTTTLSQAQIKASDSTNNNVIDSADLLKVVRYLRGTTTFGV